jgi:hypothetical protein
VIIQRDVRDATEDKHATDDSESETATKEETDMSWKTREKRMRKPTMLKFIIVLGIFGEEFICKPRLIQRRRLHISISCHFDPQDEIDWSSIIHFKFNLQQ